MEKLSKLNFRKYMKIKMKKKIESSVTVPFHKKKKRKLVKNVNDTYKRN